MRSARTLACLAVLAGLAIPSPPVAAATAPPATTSRYMKTTDAKVLYNEGCAAGRAGQSGIAVLDFGMPYVSGSTYGSYLFSNAFTSTAKIAAGAQQFLTGYWNCSPASAFLVLAVGTSNYGRHTGYNHGRAWAQMVNGLLSWINGKRFGSKLWAAAASDMELDWNSASTTRAWANGFDSANNTEYYNYGDAAGCPPYGSCNNGWTQDDVWYVSYGVSPAFPLPEIYTPNGSMAAEWYRLSLHGYSRHGQPMFIMGSFTQYQACLDSGGCSGTNNTPSAGWNQLSSKLNADSRTAQDVPYSTDITKRN